MTDDNSDKTDNNDRDLPIRESLVNTAVNFLLNHDVRNRSNESKVAFLKKKGLTDSEIKSAFEQAQVHLDPNVTSNSSYGSYGKLVLPLYQPHSFWSRLTGLSSSIIIFGVTIYGLQYFYKRYFKPWMLGEEIGQDPLHKTIKELNDTLISLTKSVEQLHTVVLKQQEDVNKMSDLQVSSGSVALILEELKNEVSCLKSILINRHQFPSVPQVQSVKPSIPSWQLASSEDNGLNCDDHPVDLQNGTIEAGETSVVDSDLSIHCVEDSEQSFETAGYSNGINEIMESSPPSDAEKQDSTDDKLGLYLVKGVE